MSRTYRRRVEEQWFKDNLRDEKWLSYLYVDLPIDVVRKRYRAHYHSDSYRCMSTPSWWVNVQMTRPQRQQVRRLLSKVMLLRDLEDTPLFPLGKKPHEYYW